MSRVDVQQSYISLYHFVGKWMVASVLSHNEMRCSTNLHFIEYWSENVELESESLEYEHGIIAPSMWHTSILEVDEVQFI